MVKTLKIACKHDISSGVSVTNLIFGVWVGHIECMIPIVFGGGQRSFGDDSCFDNIYVARNH